MFKLTDILEKLKLFKKSSDTVAQNNIVNSNVAGAVSTQSTANPIKVSRNWYEERFDKITVQRNILFVLLLILLSLSIISVIVVAIIVNSRQFDPFVIQIDESTGMAKIVNPISSEILDGNEALARYFIKRYVISRETYNPVDFDTEARKVIRLLSSSSIFWNYLGYIKNKEIDPTIVYGQKNTTFLIVKSWTKLDTKRYMLRFSINETAGDKRVFNKLAVVDFEYVPMELTEAERDINPIGFQVKGYRVDDDNS